MALQNLHIIDLVYLYNCMLFLLSYHACTMYMNMNLLVEMKLY